MLDGNRAGLFCAARLGHAAEPVGVNGVAGKECAVIGACHPDAHVFKKPEEIFGVENNDARQLFADITENLGFWGLRLDKSWQSGRTKPSIYPALSVYANTLRAVFHSCKTPAEVLERCYDMASFLYFSVETIEACRQFNPGNTQKFLTHVVAYRERARAALAAPHMARGRWRCSE